jgi:serine/threonine protein phosphatase 1
MPLTYAIADLHGRFDLLTDALAKIAEHAGGASGTVLTLGDYVDRGPESRQIIERLMLGLTDGWRLICLKGNHEDIMWQTCRVLPSASWWLQNGGGQTLLSYGHERQGPLNLSVVPDAHLDWIAGLPLMHVDRHRVFVHAGVDPSVPLDEQEALTGIHGEQKVIWRRYAKDDARGHDARHVVHGHEQYEDGPLCLAGRTDLDTFAWYTGRLVVGVFDDDVAGGPIEIIEVIGEPHAMAARAS